MIRNQLIEISLKTRYINRRKAPPSHAGQSVFLGRHLGQRVGIFFFLQQELVRQLMINFECAFAIFLVLLWVEVVSIIS